MSRTLRHLPILLIVALFSSLGVAHGQGMLVHIHHHHPIRLPRPVMPTPEPPASSYRIDSIDVNVKLKDQIAEVGISQTFQNTGSRQMEVAFVFPLPADGAIDKLTLLVDGKEFEGKVLKAEEARKIYEDIVRRNEDPALLEWLGSGMFRTSVFPVPAGAKRTVNLRYSQICKMSQGLTDFLLPLKTAKYTSGAIKNLKINVAIESSQPIKNIYSASQKVDITRSGEYNATVTYKAEDTIPSSDFRLFYDATPKGVGASVVSYRPDKKEPGYFLMLASPKIPTPDEEPPAKTVVFVVDRSGSMTGEKIEQAKGALKFVLKNLRKGDNFNIVAYDTQVETFRPELEKYTNKTRDAALGFVEGLYAGGSTNISGALDRALGMVTDSSRPTYIVFMTDGLPTAGETNESKIVDLAKKANRVRARLFSFGVGFDVNSRLLDRLVSANFGQSEYVRPNEDIEAAVSSLYNRIGTPVLTDVTLTVDVEGAKETDGPMVTRTYPAGVFDLFAGDQAVIVGRYAKHGNAKVTLSGAVAGKEKSYDFPAKLVKHSRDDTNAFIAKLWAVRRVGEIIDELDLKGKNKELLDELVALATEHGIITQYTSFLADETTARPTDVAGNVRRSGEVAEEALAETEGRYGFAQRAAKGNYKMAPQADASSLGGFGGGAKFGSNLSGRDRESLQRGIATGNAVWKDNRTDRAVVATNILQRGRKTFFRQSSNWVDSSLTDEEQKNATKIKRYSREYFDLVAEHGEHVNQYLSIDDNVIVKLDGKVYQW